MTVQNHSTPTQPAAAAPSPAATVDELLAQKDVEFYAATVNAWYATTLEHDKSLFVLAGGGIGIMISLLTAVGIDSYWILPLFVASILTYLNCLHYLLKIFEGNRDYLEAVIAGASLDADANLKRWDKIAKISFFVGVVSSLAVGLAVAALKISIEPTEQKQMTTENKVPTFDSVQGAAKLQAVQKSFHGAANMAPASGAAAAASAATTASAATQPVSAPAPAPAAAVTPTPGVKP